MLTRHKGKKSCIAVPFSIKRSWFIHFHNPSSTTQPELPATSVQTTSSLPHRGQVAVLSAAGAAAAGLASVPSAQAAILYTDFADLTYNISSGNIYLDLDRSSGGPLFASASSFGGADFHLFGYNNNNEKPSIEGTNSSNQIAISSNVSYLVNQFAANSLIAASYWLSGVGYLENGGTGYWQGISPTQDTYIGLRLNAGSGNFNYGWARVTYNDTLNTLTLKDFAIEQTSNTGINAGVGAAVPEPGRALLLALGLGGAALRRRRKAA